jgi:hypothetical protein
MLRSRDREFYNIGTQRLTHRWQKYVENDGDFVENSIIIAQDVGIIRVNFIVIEITFPEKN